MKSDNENRLLLVCFGTFRDLEKYNMQLSEGLKLTFYNEDEDDFGNRDDLVVQGIVEFDKKNKILTAIINWGDIKNISQLCDEEKIRLGICSQID
jgi:hypothetical protein